MQAQLPPAMQTAPNDPKLDFGATEMPNPQLQSLKFKADQIVESIKALHQTIELGHQPFMVPWPDILSKYNLLLSQTHTLSNSLMGTNPNESSPYRKLELHPGYAIPEAHYDTEVVPFLRTQQTMDVLKMENDTVRRISEHMATRGSLAVLGGALPSSHVTGSSHSRKPEYEDVLRECTEIREAHDRRVDRAVRAVALLKERADWKERVEVAVEEPEELTWDPRGNSPNEEEQEDEEDEDEDSEGGGDNEVHVNGATASGTPSPAPALPADEAMTIG